MTTEQCSVDSLHPKNRTETFVRQLQNRLRTLSAESERDGLEDTSWNGDQLSSSSENDIYYDLDSCPESPAEEATETDFLPYNSAQNSDSIYPTSSRDNILNHTELSLCKNNNVGCKYLENIYRSDKLNNFKSINLDSTRFSLNVSDIDCASCDQCSTSKNFDTVSLLTFNNNYNNIEKNHSSSCLENGFSNSSHSLDDQLHYTNKVEPLIDINGFSNKSPKTSHEDKRLENTTVNDGLVSVSETNQEILNGHTEKNQNIILLNNYYMCDKSCNSKPADVNSNSSTSNPNILINHSEFITKISEITLENSDSSSAFEENTRNINCNNCNGSEEKKGDSESSDSSSTFEETIQNIRCNNFDGSMENKHALESSDTSSKFEEIIQNLKYNSCYDSEENKCHLESSDNLSSFDKITPDIMYNNCNCNEGNKCNLESTDISSTFEEINQDIKCDNCNSNKDNKSEIKCKDGSECNLEIVNDKSLQYTDDDLNRLVDAVFSKSTSEEYSNSKEIVIIKSTDNEKDKEEDEESIESKRSTFRRSSSLKTGKTPPGTPGCKKMVRFADVFGLDLADVRTFLDEVPRVPKSAFVDLKNIEISSSPPVHSLPMDFMGQGVISSLNAKTQRIIVPLFQQPSSRPEFLDRIRDNFVCLENAIVSDPVLSVITGIVRVKNVDFHKSVHIRYSIDNWKSFADLQAKYLQNSCDGFSDKFSFMLYAHMLNVGQRLEFAVRYHTKGSLFWDNNLGVNYVFQCVQDTPSKVASSTFLQPSSVETWASFY